MGRGVGRSSGMPLWALGAALLLALAAYFTALQAPFQFDDIPFVAQNDALHSLWPPGRWIHSGAQETRPLANLSFALNWAWTGAATWSYHALNLGLHATAVVLLFFLVQRTLRATGTRSARRADWVAAGAALLYATHAAHSESVIYIQGRPGLLATTFGLAALARAAFMLPQWNASHRVAGTAQTAALVALAVLSKESAAVLPMILLLYDLALVSAWRWKEIRPRLLTFHAPQWATLLLLAWVFSSVHNPHRGVFGFGVVDRARFYLTQPLALLSYLRLYLWPSPLSIDHHFPLLTPGDPKAWLGVVSLATLLGAMLWALRRAPWLGFCAAWWFLALAPTTLVPGREFFAERYLTFATPAFAAFAASAIAAALERLAPAAWRPAAPSGALVICGMLSLLLAWTTLRRARVWNSGETLWRSAVAVSPHWARAWVQYGYFLQQETRYRECELAARRALALAPREVHPQMLMARALSDLGSPDSALPYARQAVALGPRLSQAHLTLGTVLIDLHRWEEAERACDQAVRLKPLWKDPFFYRAYARANRGEIASARADARTLMTRYPDSGHGPFLMGYMDLSAGRDSSAERWLGEALRREPGHSQSLRYQPLALFKLGRTRQALQGWQLYFDRSHAESWDYAMLYYVGLCQQQLGQDREAMATLGTVVRLRPQLAPAWLELAYTLAAPHEAAARDPERARAALAQGLARAPATDPAIRERAAQVRAALEARR